MDTQRHNEVTILDTEPHDAHIQQARKMFRACGLDLHAMQFPRCPEALAALRAYNRVPDNFALAAARLNPTTGDEL